MKIGNTRIWIDDWMIRSSNYATHSQPFEAGINKHWRMPGFKIYEDTSECDGIEVRLSAELLWFYVNMLLFCGRNRKAGWNYDGRQWGFYFMDRINFVFRWSKRYFSFDLPFVSLVHVKHEILSLDRKRVVHLCGRIMDDFDKQQAVKKENSAEYPYRYVLKNGEVQNVTASVCVERWTHRYKWTPFFRIRDSIWITFSDEVGEGHGSWKGGTIGCGWSMKSAETAEQCLRRMEKERRFGR